MAQMVSFAAGMHINDAAELLCREANKGSAVRGSFNDIELNAEPGDTPDMVVATFSAAMEAARIAYLNSPQKAKDDTRREVEISALQDKHDDLMSDLATLDWSSDVAVLDWLCAMQHPSDHVGVIKRHQEVLEAFALHGFEPSANIGAAFNGENRENYFRYVVGLALSTMQVCAIHGMVHKFTSRWKKKFAI